MRIGEFADDFEDALAVGLAGHLEVEAADVHLEEVGEEAGVVDVGAVGGVVIAAGADVDADLAALVGGEAVEDLVVEGDEAAQEVGGGIELEGEAGFGEVDLNGGCAGVERAADVGFGFVDQVGEEGFARVAGDLGCGIEEAESGGGDDGLLERALV